MGGGKALCHQCNMRYIENRDNIITYKSGGGQRGESKERGVHALEESKGTGLFQYVHKAHYTQLQCYYAHEHAGVHACVHHTPNANLIKIPEAACQQPYNFMLNQH